MRADFLDELFRCPIAVFFYGGLCYLPLADEAKRQIRRQTGYIVAVAGAEVIVALAGVMPSGPR